MHSLLVAEGERLNWLALYPRIDSRATVLTQDKGIQQRSMTQMGSYVVQCSRRPDEPTSRHPQELERITDQHQDAVQAPRGVHVKMGLRTMHMAPEDEHRVCIETRVKPGATVVPDSK